MEEEPRDGWRIAEGKNRSVAAGEGGIAGDGDDIVLFRPERRLAEFGSVHLDLCDRGRFEAFREIEVGRCHAGEQGGKIRLGSCAVIVKQHEAIGGGEHRFVRSGLAMAETVLARLVGVDLVVRVLQGRDLQARAAEQGQKGAGSFIRR